MVQRIGESGPKNTYDLIFSPKINVYLLKGRGGGIGFYISSDTLNFYTSAKHECKKFNLSRVVGRCSMYHEKCKTIATSFPL